MYSSGSSAATGRHISLKERVSTRLWERIESASKLGESLHIAQTCRSAKKNLTSEQITILAHHSGLIESETKGCPPLSNTLNQFFPRENLSEDTLHLLSKRWQDSNLYFNQRTPCSQLSRPELIILGVHSTPAHYIRHFKTLHHD